MKTPLPPTARFRALLFVLALLSTTILPAFAEWITLQIPLARSGHAFSFWQKDASGSESALIQGYEASGYPDGDYFRQASGSPILIGGTFDSGGVWHPNSGAYATVSAFRDGSGPFFLYDEFAQDLAPPNQTGLVAAQWHPYIGGEGYKFFAVAADKISHVLVLIVSNGTNSTFQPLSTGQEQGFINANGTFESYGFFEAWAPVGGDWPDYAVVDLTEGKQSPWNLYNLTDATWDAPTLAIPSFTVVFAVGEHNSSNLFTFSCDDNSGSTLAPGWMEFPDGTWGYGVSGSVSAGRSYWLSSGDFFTEAWQMGVVPAFRHVENVFPPAPGSSTIPFRISGSLNPWAFAVRCEATQAFVNLSVAGWENATTIYNSSTGQWQTVNYYDAWATGDFSAGFTVFDASGGNQGATVDFFDLGSGSPPFSGELISAIPATRVNHAMVSNEGFQATWNTSIVPIPAYDAFFQTPFSYDVAMLSAPYVDLNALNYNLTVTDQVLGDTSPGIDPGYTAATPYLWQTWHPRQPLLLKVSATRWRNQLQIHCADGVIHPVTPRRLQGDWSLDPVRNTMWFNPYGLFDASTFRQAGIPWHLYDATRHVYLTADGADENSFSFVNATDNTDTDNDGLKDWYEALIGTNSNNANTDGDTQGNDGFEVANGTNPLAKPSTATDSTLKVFTPLE